MKLSNHFDPVDWEGVQRWANLSVGMRIQTLLDARALALGLMRGRLRQRYPNLSTAEINSKMIEDLDQLDD
jgi:hypothetical protein